MENEQHKITAALQPVVLSKEMIQGYGPANADTMLVLQAPFAADMQEQRPLADAEWDLFLTMCREAQLDLDTMYITYAVKFIPDTPGKPKRKEFTACKDLLLEEIKAVKPKLVVTFGADIVKILFGQAATLAQFNGDFTTCEGFDCTFFPMNNPNYVNRYPESRATYVGSLAKIIGTFSAAAATISYRVINNIVDLNTVVDYILSKSNTTIAIDCEWEGDNIYTKGGYLRTIQLKFSHKLPDGNDIIIIKLRDAATAVNDEGLAEGADSFMGSLEHVGEKLKRLLESNKVNVIGHAIREDGKWLKTIGVDIRETTVFDTMLAEHCLNCLGPFGLEVLSCKYTNLGRYDIPLNKWKNDNKQLVQRGFGCIPDDVLFPYAALDVEATYQIFLKQLELLTDFAKPRGEYPSIFDAAMLVSKLLYEVEETGILIDRQRLNVLTELYHYKLNKLDDELVNQAKDRFGIEDFNYDSAPNRNLALFENLKFAPIKSTASKGRARAWSWVQQQSPAIQKQYSPCSDKETLEILATHDPFVKLLLNTKRVATVCKDNLRQDNTGGLSYYIQKDGKVHARFSQLAETARFRHSEPNIANLPKAAEGYLREIFKEESAVINELFGTDYPPGIRSLFIADEGYSFVEADYVQAELYVTGFLSKDEEYKRALTTPGLDLHDETAIRAFNLKIEMADGSVYNEKAMLELATKDIDAFKKIQKTLIYVRSNGTKMSRDEFKNTIRVAAKSVVFGTLYGRGAQAISRKIQSETGNDIEVDLIQAALDTWHSTYVNASKFLESYGKQALTNGYIYNAFGRKRTFAPAVDNESRGAIQREAFNFPIQSTVADIILLSLCKLVDERKVRGLNFKIVNIIHDAIMVLAPDNEVDATKQILKDVMSSIKIPINTKEYFCIPVDTESFKRWGDKSE